MEMRWSGHASRTATNVVFLLGNIKGQNHLGDKSADTGHY